MTIAVVAVVCMIALAAFCAFAFSHVGGVHSALTSALIADQAEERHAWARERQELLTRIQAPHLVPAPLPVVPPGDDGAGDKPSDPYDDQIHLVGQILSTPVDEDGNPIHEAA